MRAVLSICYLSTVGVYRRCYLLSNVRAVLVVRAYTNK
jgi:hypothetical protein